MKIVHRFGVHIDDQVIAALDQLGVRYDPHPPLITLDIAESDADWQRVSELMRSLDALSFPRMVFTAEEVRTAAYLRMLPGSHTGYPQPEANFGYLSHTYHLSDFCRHCGMGGRQIRPFRIKAGINWADKRIRQLNWVFDEYFVPRNVYVEVFEPLGVPFWPVIHHRTGQEIPDAVQLRVDSVAGPVSGLESSPAETCAQCGRKRFLPLVRQQLPVPFELPAAVLFKTAEVFGSGFSAQREIVAAQVVRERLEAMKVKGGSWEPLASPGV